MDNILQIHTAGRILAQPIDEWHGRMHVVGGRAADVLQVDQRAVALDLAVEEGLDASGRIGGDFDVERGVGGGLSGIGEDLRG